MPGSEISIFRAGPEDAAVLTRLSVSTFRESFGPHNRQEDMDKYIEDAMSVTKLTQELQDSGNHFFLVSCDAETVGYAKMRSIEQLPELSEHKQVEIERIYVDQRYHSRKIGAALMAHCLDHARRGSYDVVWLGVWEHNHKAVTFYRKWGFELFSSHPFMLGYDLQTDVLMKKHL
jgi:ribosomal protein S18 acetylase RimI-like enzyme